MFKAWLYDPPCRRTRVQADPTLCTRIIRGVLKVQHSPTGDFTTSPVSCPSSARYDCKRRMPIFLSYPYNYSVISRPRVFARISPINSALLRSTGWRFDQRSCSTSSPVSTGMGDCLRAGKLSHYVTSHPGQLSLSSFRGR